MVACDFMFYYIRPVPKPTATKKQVSIRDSDKFIDAWSFILYSQYGMNLLEIIYCSRHSINIEHVN